jgi:DNA-binding transcriptional MocR family regulator
MNEHLAVPRLSERIDRLKPSLVREILAAATRPDMISFAGGLPAADLMPAFPLDAVAAPSLYQYGATEGEPAFRSAVAQWIRQTGLPVAENQVLPLAGSQQGLDLAAKLLVDRGTPMLTEAPTYLAALQVFEFFGAAIATIPLNDDGPDLEQMERRLATHKPACLYLVPTFQNPTGTCYTAKARQGVAELLDHYGTTLIEDDPYRAVSLEDGNDAAPICALLKRAPWIYLGSFSKILWPGWRIGYLAAREDLLPQLVSLKQAAELHTQRPVQHAIATWLGGDTRDAHLRNLRTGYRQRRDAMHEALTRHLGSIAEWRIPSGGLFFWIRLKQHLATRELLNETMRRGVAFMPGEVFYPGTHGDQRTMRLNYSHATPGQMDLGLAVLADMLTGGTAR